MPFVRRFLSVDGECVSLVDPHAFEEAYAKAKQSELERKLGQPSAKKGGSYIAALQRKLALWGKVQPRASLAGLILPSGEVVTTAPEISEGLAAHWSQTFRWKPTESPAMTELASFLSPLPPMAPPSRKMAAAAIRYARNKAPGADGLPAEAWRAAGELGIDLCWESVLWLLGGKSFSSFWSSALLIYPPKKVRPGERKAERRAKDPRPISLKATANRSTMAVFSMALRDPIVKWASPQQRGFIPSRNLCWNVIEADHACRVAYFERSPGQLPSAWALDLAAAFPNVARMWMFFVLTAIKAPVGLVDMVRHTHKENRAVALDSGIAEFKYELASGVQQGCPFSGVMSVLSFDACVRALVFQLGVLGWVFACADDLFLIIRTLELLSCVTAVFSLLSRATGLELNLGKCVGVPLWAEATPQTLETLRIQVCEYSMHLPSENLL